MACYDLSNINLLTRLECEEEVAKHPETGEVSHHSGKEKKLKDGESPETPKKPSKICGCLG